MSANTTARWNPFYILLIIVSFAFVVTALAYAIVPVLEQKAVESGNPPPPAAWRDALRSDGWIWLLSLGGAVCLLGILSMGYDRLLRALLGSDDRPTSLPPSSPMGSASHGE